MVICTAFKNNFGICTAFLKNLSYFWFYWSLWYWLLYKRGAEEDKGWFFNFVVWHALSKALRREELCSEPNEMLGAASAPSSLHSWLTKLWVTSRSTKCHPQAATGQWVSLWVCSVIGWLIVYQLGILDLYPIQSDQLLTRVRL